MAKTLSRSSTASLGVFYHRFFSTTSRSVSPYPLLHSNLISRGRSSPSSLIGFIPNALTRLTTIRAIGMDRSAESKSYVRYLPDLGRDYKHWLIFFRRKPVGKYANKQQMIDCYVQTLAKIVGSEEEAKRKIYKLEWEAWYGFGCEVDEETLEKLHELPEVRFVLPDSYADPEYKDYGGELVVNGKLVQRTPERQRRIDSCFQGSFCED